MASVIRTVSATLASMTGRQFYDWQTAGGADDVMRMVDALERAELHWCAIDGIAVSHWAAEPLVTRDVDFVVTVDEIDRDVPADVHGILLRVASIDDTLAGKIKAWRTPERRPSKAIKDLGDIARLIEAHPQLATSLPADVSQALSR